MLFRFSLHTLSKFLFFAICCRICNAEIIKNNNKATNYKNVASKVISKSNNNKKVRTKNVVLPKKSITENLDKKILHFTQLSSNKIEIKIDNQKILDNMRIFQLFSPNRIVFDFNTNDINNVKIEIASSIKIRKSTNQGKCRIVFDILHDTNNSIKVLKITKNDKIIVETNKPLWQNRNILTTQQMLINNQINNKSNNNNVVVAIDAGHGGKDPGTIGSLKIPEKNITLLYAKELNKRLQKLGIKTIMTRINDSYISLYDRAKIANDHNASIFISFHADSAKSPKAHGTTIYTLSDINERHQDWQAFRRVEYLPSHLKSYAADLNIIDMLIKMFRKVTKDDTHQIAEKMLIAFERNQICSKCSHKKQSLAVLRNINIPSILIEVGYITNKKDELKIISQEFIEKMCTQIADIISK
jgi:N-acetylmuramoyl-L-alanine amidase